MSSPSPGQFSPAEDHLVLSRMVILGCTARKALTPGPLPALELYEGGCVPQLRARLGGDPRLRARVRFLSAEHGLVTADTPLHPYDRPLDPDRAVALRPAVIATLHRDMTTDGVPYEVLVVAEPLYLVLLADLLALPARPRVHWIPDHAHGWPQARAVLDQWGW
ncbi:MAG: hypothetical protein ACRDRR_21915 [Pseudonocardiaceae bacterium]